MMNPREALWEKAMDIKDPIELKKFWEAHIDAWKETALTQTAYCREHELSVHRFSYWKRKRTQRDTPVSDASGFIQLNTTGIKPTTECSTLVVQLPNQLRIEGIAADNLHLVKQLAGLLQ